MSINGSAHFGFWVSLPWGNCKMGHGLNFFRNMICHFCSSTYVGFLVTWLQRWVKITLPKYFSNNCNLWKLDSLKSVVYDTVCFATKMSINYFPSTLLTSFNLRKFDGLKSVLYRVIVICFLITTSISQFHTRKYQWQSNHL